MEGLDVFDHDRQKETFFYGEYDNDIAQIVSPKEVWSRLRDVHGTCYIAQMVWIWIISSSFNMEPVWAQRCKTRHWRDKLLKFKKKEVRFEGHPFLDLFSMFRPRKHSFGSLLSTTRAKPSTLTWRFGRDPKSVLNCEVIFQSALPSKAVNCEPRNKANLLQDSYPAKQKCCLRGLVDLLKDWSARWVLHLPKIWLKRLRNLLKFLPW